MREIKGTLGVVIGAWAVAAALFHLWTSGFGFFEPRTQRSFHLLLLLPHLQIALRPLLDRRLPDARSRPFRASRKACRLTGERVGVDGELDGAHGSRLRARM